MKSSKPYIPSDKILEKYARVLVRFALGGGNGIKKGDVVYLIVHECAKPFFVLLRREILKAGGHPIIDYRPDNDHRSNIAHDFYLHADDDQVGFFPEHYMKGLVNQIDHSIFILSETDKQALKKVDPVKIMRRNAAFKPYSDWRNEKENQGKFTWTIALFGTPAMAKEAGLTEREYWNQIIKACFLDYADPVAKWQEVYKEMEETRKKLNRLSIDKLHIQGQNVDLWVKIGEKRQWVGGSGRNVPSFEIFTSPDWRGTQGWVKFDQPLYHYGNLVTGIELEFNNGLVVESKAKKGEKILNAMIQEKNANKIGEFSLTDRRFSHITKFMAETLYDENMGGPEGNFHLALGNSYHDCFAGKPDKMKKTDWAKLGFNDSVVHTDIISTSSRTVTAYLENGQSKIIYKNGEFTI